MTDIRTSLVDQLNQARAAGKLTEWRIKDQVKDQIELYFVGDAPETRRTVRRATLVVEVLTLDDLLGTQGYARTVLTPGSADLTDRLNALYEMAQSSQNSKSWSFPEPNDAPIDNQHCHDSRVAEDPKAAVWAAGQSWTEALGRLPAGQRGGHLELIFSKSTVSVHTHLGRVSETAQTELYVEGSITTDTHERLFLRHGSNLDRLKIAELVEQASTQLTQMDDIVTPPTGDYGLLIHVDAVSQLFRAAVFDLQGSSVYTGVSRLKVGDRFGPEGTSIRINEPIVGLGASAIDEDGERIAAFPAVSDGVVTQLIAPRKYACLLDVTKSGGMTSMSVAPGRSSETELYEQAHAQPTIEVLEFSHLFPERESKDFAAEIRFGYLHKDGARIPIRGGSISGNVLEILKDASLSSEADLDFGNPGLGELPYEGPRTLFAPQVDYAGTTED